MEEECTHPKEWVNRSPNGAWNICGLCRKWSYRDTNKWELSNCACNKACPPNYCRWAHIWQHIDDLESKCETQQEEIENLRAEIELLKKK
jgi:hypothetical protein